MALGLTSTLLAPSAHADSTDYCFEFLKYHPAQYEELTQCRDFEWYECAAMGAPECCAGEPACRTNLACYDIIYQLISEEFWSQEVECDLSWEDVLRLAGEGLLLTVPGCPEFIDYYENHLKAVGGEPLPGHLVDLLDEMRNSPITAGLPPVLTTSGITVPVWRHHDHQLVTLTDEDFWPDPNAWGRW